MRTLLRFIIHSAPCVIAGSLLYANGTLAQQTAPPQRPQPIIAWSAQPAQPTQWTAPNKPHWKLSEVLAKHSGQRSWQEQIVSDRDFVARYIAMAPGEKMQRHFFADDRVFWIVQAGRMRVHIDGQPSFEATPGFLVQVPYRTAYHIVTWNRNDGSVPMVSM